MKKTLIAVAITGCIAVSGVVAVAAQNNGKGNILSSKEISKKALSYVKGQVYKVELDHEKSGPIYEVDVKNKQANYELKLDAKTGELLEKSTRYSSNDPISNKMIGITKAKKIALKLVNGKIQKAKLDLDDNVYEIEIIKGKYKYEIDINAYTGKIVKKDKEKSSLSKNGKVISLREAKQIALNYLNGVVRNAKYNRENGTYVIQIAKNSRTYRVDIDAYTGEIVKKENNVVTSTVSSNVIGIEKAKQIALNAIGGTVTEATLDSAGVYIVKVQNGEFEYQVEINSTTGTIIKQKQVSSSQDLANTGTNTIGIEKAKQIALSKVSGTITSASYDQDDGVYEISIVANGTEYDFDINAQTGDIIKQDQKSEEDTSSNNDSTIITSQQASQIALTKAKGTVTKIELNGNVYDVEVKDGTFKYEIKIDATTGDVLNVDKDYEN
ncbi:PepSY domain-containing protein [Rummeliibacillus pycnus]|uniref:PepSY domain-containing protein n=1 Tax=Rummeliibacillus pycnus TaxID=101070 RepID=UPI003D2BFBCF